MSKVYENETFYRPFLISENRIENVNCEWIDCDCIDGTNCYADPLAVKQLRSCIRNVDARGLHFIDSGNYHYLSYLFVEKIPIDFELILFDNHPDCKRPMFGEILSCGGWIRDALVDNEHLKKVIMVGVDNSLLEEIDDISEYRDKVEIFSKEEFIDYIKNDKLSRAFPAYISIDKDVLSDKDASCNWDQGDMRMCELVEMLELINNYKHIIGVDVCGENDAMQLEGNDLNDLANSKMIECYLQMK